MVQKKKKGGRYTPPRKPRGQQGYLSLGQTAGAFVPVELPRSKEDIEAIIVARAMRNRSGGERFLLDIEGDPIQNPEDDHDFTLRKPTGDERLELVEITDPRGAGRPGSTRPPAGNAAFADIVRGNILEKSRRYGLGRPDDPRRIHLLLYATDLKWRVNESIQQILMAELAEANHGFLSVLLYEPDDETDGRVVELAPVDPAVLAAIPVDRLRARWTIQVDLSKARFHGDGTMRVPLNPPPDFQPPR